MRTKKTIIGINGSASQNSSNLQLLRHIASVGESEFDLVIIEDLASFPNFRTELTDENVPEEIVEFRNQIAQSDGVIISTPEYIFSVPSGLKNAIEWCVSTTVFSDKPIGIVTASASGENGHEELKLIMKTVQTIFTDDTTLLIQGIKGKMDKNGNLTDATTIDALNKFVKSYTDFLNDQS